MALDISTARLDIAKIYIAAFNRVPDSDGLNFWVNAYLNGASLASIASGFATSTEYTTKYPSYQTNTEYVAAVYQNVFGRAVDTDGSKFWTGALDAGTLTKAGLLNSLVSAAAANGSTDGARLTNQAEFGVYCASNNIQWTNATTALSAITSDTATVTTAKTTVSTNEANTSHILTTGQDTPVGTSGNDEFRAVAGVANGNQDQTTLNSSDVIDGGAGTDTLIVNMTGATYSGGARIKNIETLQIGTDLAAAAFDYNVNMGSNEVSEVETIRYDQINTGEDLTVKNIIKTATTNTAIPTILWDNEANSTAGEIDVDFRTSATDGSSTSLTVKLDDVIADVKTATTGVLNIASGVESLTVNSQGTSTRNTLNKSDNTTTNAVDADLASGTSGSLTSVTLTGSVEIGKAATVITTTTDAEYGYTNRAAASDLGIENADSSVKGTASNLLSVAASVTTVDASAMTAATNVRFTNYTDGTTKDVTYKGGSAADYVEFEAGKVNATGNAGADTFAFINANTARSGFDSTDVITGGEGSDTIQLGVNGSGTYTLNTTEFNNKSGIDVLDLRGNSNTVTLSDGFVSSADAGTFTVYTSKIIQTSDTNTANPTRTAGTNYIEDNAITTLDTTALAQNRALKFEGGSGSDRLIMDNDSYNQYVILAGGTNLGQSGATATAADYDTLTVVNGANLDAGDLANTSGFEAMILTDTTSGSQSYQITLTEAFLSANTASSDSSATDIDDRAFVIATDNVTSTGGAVLAAGDTVQIDISNLLDTAGTTLKSSLSGRYVDVSSIIRSGAVVTFVKDGVTVAANSAAALAATGNTSTAAAVSSSASTIVGNDTGAPVAVALTANQSYTGTAGVNDNFTGDYASLNNTTITGTNGDTETLTMTGAVAAAIGGGGAAGTITNIDNLVLANVANTVTFGGTTGITSITGGTAADNVTLGALGVTVSASMGAGADTLVLTTATAYTGTFTGGDGVDTLSVDTSTATDITGATVSGFDTLKLTNGAGGTGLSVDGSIDLGQFSTITDDGAIAFKISVTGGSHDISSATLSPGAGTPDIFDVAAGASLTIAGNAQATAANYTFTGLGTLNSTATVTLANALDIIANVTLTGSSAADVIDDSLNTARTITGNSAANKITLGLATASKTIDISSGGVDLVNTSATADTGKATITGFTVADDHIGLKAATTTALALSASTTTAIQNEASNPTATLTFNTAASNVLELAYDFSTVGDLTNATNGTALLAGLGQTLAVSADTNKGYVIAYQNSKAYIYYVVEGADVADVNVAAADVALVAVLNNVAVGALTSTDIWG